MLPISTSDLRPSERVFVHAMQNLGFGHFEGLSIVAGQIALDPWPRMVQSLKFGGDEQVPLRAQFQLKRQVIQFLERVRSIEDGEIRFLEVRHGLPFAGKWSVARL